MTAKLLTLTAIGAALTLLGAACSPKATVTSGNTNVSVNVPVNAIINAANSQTTGDFSTSTNTAVNAGVNAAAKTVTITAAGVSPKTLTVPVGTTVTFVNTDTISHQIASDPHPSHSGLSGFDNTSLSQSYTYTFTKSGSYGYHDHQDGFNSAMKGTIIVQ